MAEQTLGLRNALKVAWLSRGFTQLFFPLPVDAVVNFSPVTGNSKITPVPQSHRIGFKVMAATGMGLQSAVTDLHVC